MERSAINSRLEPLLRSQRAFQKLGPLEKTHDLTILVAGACVIIAAIIAIYALTASGPMDPNAFTTMVAVP
jgi:hypothetical protein